MNKQVPIIGQKQIAITVSQLCVFCFPDPKPGVFIYKGCSVCAEHFGAERDAEKKAAEEKEQAEKEN